MRQKNNAKSFRFEDKAAKLLADTAQKAGLNETEVIEACLSLYAARFPELAAQCREALMAVVAGELGKASSRSANGPPGTGDTAFVKKVWSKAGQAEQPSPAAGQQASPGDGRGTSDGQGRSPSKPRRKFLS